MASCARAAAQMEVTLPCSLTPRIGLLPAAGCAGAPSTTRPLVLPERLALKRCGASRARIPPPRCRWSAVIGSRAGSRAQQQSHLQVWCPQTACPPQAMPHTGRMEAVHCDNQSKPPSRAGPQHQRAASKAVNAPANPATPARKSGAISTACRRPSRKARRLTRHAQAAASHGLNRSAPSGLAQRFCGPRAPVQHGSRVSIGTARVSQRRTTAQLGPVSVAAIRPPSAPKLSRPGARLQRHGLQRSSHSPGPLLELSARTCRGSALRRTRE